MATDEEFSYFTLGSGLPLDGATVRVVSAEFTIDNSYAAGAVILDLGFQPVVPSTLEDADGDVQHQKFSVGKNFEPKNRGEEVGHTSGKNVKINNQSIYGRWIHAALEQEGAAEFMGEARTRQLEPNSALLWLGMVFELGSYEYEAQDGKPKTGIQPIKYLGTVEGGAAPAAAPKAAAAPAKKAGPAKAAAAPAKAAAAPASAGRTVPPRPGAPKAAAPAAVVEEFSGTIEGVDQEWTDWLIGVAATHTEFNDFMEEAMGTEGVAGQEALEAAIMSQKEGSLWAKHHG